MAQEIILRYNFALIVAITMAASTTTTGNPLTGVGYSGRLIDSEGQPQQGTASLEVSFYDAAEGGNAKSSPEVYSVELENGLFTIEVNFSTSDLDNAFDPTTDTWIQIRDTTNNKLYPRQKITSVPFAIKVPVDGTSVHYVDGALSTIKEPITADDIENNAIAEENIENGAITTDKLEDNAVTSPKIQDGTLVDADIAADAAIATSKLAGLGSLATLDEVATAQVADDAITTGKIANATIGDDDIAADASIASSKIAGLGGLATLNSVDTSKIDNNAIDSSKIANASIVNEDIAADAAILSSKIAGLGALATLNEVASSQIQDGSIQAGDLSTLSYLYSSKIRVGPASSSISETYFDYWPLAVTSTASTSVCYDGRVDLSGSTMVSSYRSTCDYSRPVSIFAEGRVFGSEFNLKSDKRAKEEITAITNAQAMRFIDESRPVHFKWKNEKGSYSYGFIAQEIDKIGFRDLVTVVRKKGMEEVIDEDGYLSPKDTLFQMNYDQIVSILTKAIQVLKSTIVNIGDQASDNERSIENLKVAHQEELDLLHKKLRESEQRIEALLQAQSQEIQIIKSKMQTSQEPK